MSKQLKNSIICASIIALIWIVAALLFNDIYWGGFIFGIIAIVITFGYIFLFRTRSIRNEEVDFIPLICAIGYLLVALVMNVVFMLSGSNDSVKLLVLLNILLILIFAAAIYFAGRYADGVAEKTEKLIEKKKNTANASLQTAALLSISSDPDIKKALKDLKTKIDYSGNTTQAITQSAEEEFISKIEEIKTAVINKEDKLKILDMISDANRIWSERNALHASVK
ncbi:MAG: hypothetical protein K6E85_01695 [Lachnospiraceae bacterium]|nr:hypothetical protein [Lachnospiraceae bacterium]